MTHTPFTDSHFSSMAPLAGSLPPDVVQRLRERGDVRRFSKGEVFIVEGAAAESLFVLLSGSLMAFSKDERGREVIYNSIEPGEVFGEVGLADGIRSASVKAVTHVDCLEVRHDDIQTLMQQCPALAEVLVVKLIERLRHSTAQVRSMALDNVFVRTVASINDLAMNDGEHRYLPAKVTQKLVASRIGATREMVNHVFRRLMRSGHLVRDVKLGLVIAKPLPGRP